MSRGFLTLHVVGTKIMGSDAKVIQFSSTEIKLPEDLKELYSGSDSNTYVGSSLSGFSESDSDTYYETDTNTDDLSRDLDKPLTIHEKRVKFESNLTTVIECKHGVHLHMRDFNTNGLNATTDEGASGDEDTDEDSHENNTSIPSLTPSPKHVDKASVEEDTKKAVHPFLEFNKYQKFTKLAWDVSSPFSTAMVRKDRKGKFKYPILPSDLLASAIYPASTNLEIEFPALPWKPLKISKNNGIAMKDIGDEVYNFLQLNVQGEEYHSFPHGMQQAISTAFNARCDKAKAMGGSESEERVRRSGIRRVDALAGATEFISLHPVTADVYQLYTIIP